MHTKNHDIYLISNLNIFKDYVQKVILKNIQGKITVFVVFNSLESFVPILAFLSSFNDIEARQQQKQKYCDDYVYYLKQLQMVNGDGASDVYESDLHLYSGQCDQPLPFELVVILDSQSLKGDHLSPRSISIQQLLRLLTLKHGGLFACISNTPQIMSKSDSVLDVLLQIGYQPNSSNNNEHTTRPKPIPIYQQSQVSANSDIKVHLLIPKGWDSWNKIQILATSSIADTEDPSYYTLSNEIDSNKLNLMYNTYLETIHTNPEQNTPNQNEENLLATISMDHKSSKNSPAVKHESVSLEDTLKKIYSEI